MVSIMTPERAPVRHLNVPLEEGLYLRLRAEAERTGRPATRIVREAIVRLLEEAIRGAIHEGIASYAAAIAGSRDDLDPDLEDAAVELLRDGDAEAGAPATVREKPHGRARKRGAAGKGRAKGRRKGLGDPA